MIRNANLNSSALFLLFQSFVAVPSNAHGNEPFSQADVYNALYEAHVECDDNLDQSRSEFITDMHERNGGYRLSMEMLRKFLIYNVHTAKQSITEKTQERELYISEILHAPKVSSEKGVEQAEASKERHEKVRQIDDFLKIKRRYVDVHECVLEALEKVSHE